MDLSSCEGIDHREERDVMLKDEPPVGRTMTLPIDGAGEFKTVDHSVGDTEQITRSIGELIWGYDE